MFFFLGIGAWCHRDPDANNFTLNFPVVQQLLLKGEYVMKIKGPVWIFVGICVWNLGGDLEGFLSCLIC